MHTVLVNVCVNAVDTSVTHQRILFPLTLSVLTGGRQYFGKHNNGNGPKQNDSSCDKLRLYKVAMVSVRNAHGTASADRNLS